MKESSDGETLMAVGIWFQIWGAAEEKARRTKQGILRVGEFICASEIFLKPTPITMVTKIWKFEHKITVSRLAYDSPLPYRRPKNSK